MNYARKYIRAFVNILIASVLGAFVFVLRYIIKTPQPLKSVLPGEDRLYKWTQGHIFYKVFGAEDAPPACPISFARDWRICL